VRTYPSYEAVVDAAAAGEVRVFCMDRPPATYFLVRKGLAQAFRSTAPLYAGHFHRAVHKGQRAVLQQVEWGFAQISPEQWREIETSWLGEPVKVGRLQPYVRYAGYGLTGLAAVVLGITEGVVNAHYRQARQADAARKFQQNLREERARTAAVARRALGSGG
jgi:hypothetical protein